MNPQPYPTRLERAAEFDVAAKIAHENGDPARSEWLCREAHLLRMEEAQEAKNVK